MTAGSRSRFPVGRDVPYLSSYATSKKNGSSVRPAKNETPPLGHSGVGCEGRVTLSDPASEASMYLNSTSREPTSAGAQTGANGSLMPNDPSPSRKVFSKPQRTRLISNVVVNPGGPPRGVE